TPFYAIWYKLPKLLFVLAYLATTYQLHEHLFKDGIYTQVLDRNKSLFIIYFFFISPYVWWHVWTGFFDGIVGLLVFNIYLVIQNKKLHVVVKELLILFLVLVIISIKFIGLFLLVPFVFMEYNNHASGLEGSRDHTTRLKSVAIKLLIFCGMVIALVLILSSFFEFRNIINPFIIHTRRGYETVFEFASWNNEPFSMQLVVYLYSSLGLPVFLVSMGGIYIFCARYKVSNEAWIILPVLAFLIFFPVSHAQFLFWILHLLAIYYVRTARRANFHRHMFYTQLIAGGAVFWFYPLAQFMYLWMLFEICRREKNKEHFMVGDESESMLVVVKRFIATSIFGKTSEKQ
nr:hypothetical protein [Candidatus Sigynarchaeota archaeon]